MRKTLIVAFVIGFCGFIGALESSAQSIQTFMFIPGIPGETLDSRHRDWIDVISIRHTLEQASGSVTGGTQATRIPRTACEIEILKLLDRSGPLLWMAAVTGNTFTEVRIEVVRTGELQQKVYEIRLTNVRVSSISTANEAGAFPLESVVLTAERVVLSYITVNPSTGQPSGPVNANINCGTNKAA